MRRHNPHVLHDQPDFPTTSQISGKREHISPPNIEANPSKVFLGITMRGDRDGENDFFFDSQSSVTYLFRSEIVHDSSLARRRRPNICPK